MPCGKVIKGKALALGAVYENVNIFNETTKIIANTPLPLLVDHDPNKVVGNVLGVYTLEDGLYYIAELDDETICIQQQDTPDLGVSVGGEYNPNENVLKLYEISITDRPYFKLTKNFSIILHMKEEQKNVQAQDLSAMEEMLNQHQAEIEAIKSELEGIKATVESLSAAFTALKDELMNKQTEAVVEAAEKLMPAFVSKVDQLMAKTFQNIFSNLAKS